MRDKYHFSGRYYSGLGYGSGSSGDGWAWLVLGLLLSFVFGIVTLYDAVEDLKNRKRYLDALFKIVFVLGGMAGGVLLGLFLGSLSPYGFAAILLGFFVGLCLGGGLGGLLGNLAAWVTAMCCDDFRRNSYGKVDVGERLSDPYSGYENGDDVQFPPVSSSYASVIGGAANPFPARPADDDAADSVVKGGPQYPYPFSSAPSYSDYSYRL